MAKREGERREETEGEREEREGERESNERTKREPGENREVPDNWK